MSVRLIFSLLDSVTPAVLLLLLAVRYRTRPFPFCVLDRLLVVYLSVQLVLNGIGIWLSWVYNYNMYIYHMNCFVTQVIFTLYFLQLLRDGVARQIVWITSLFFIAFFFFSLFILQPFEKFNSYNHALGAFFLVLYSLLAFHKWMQVLPAANILALKEFWGAAGVLFYFGSAFSIFISYEYLIQVTYKTVITVWLLHNFFMALGCVIFTKAILSKEWIRESSSSSVERSSPLL